MPYGQPTVALAEVGPGLSSPVGGAAVVGAEEGGPVGPRPCEAGQRTDRGI